MFELTSREITLIFEALRTKHGWHPEDVEILRLQGKLSILAEVKAKSETRREASE